MDRTLTALARARYRPARLSVLAPWVLAVSGAERLARDVSLRWEEAADAFLEVLRALGRGERPDSIAALEAPTGAGPGGFRSGGDARARSWWGRRDAAAMPPRAHLEVDGPRGDDEISPGAAEGEPPGAVEVTIFPDRGGVEATRPRARPLAADVPAGGVGPRVDDALEDDLAADSRSRPGHGAHLDAPGRAGGWRPGDPAPLARPDGASPKAIDAPARRRRTGLAPEPGTARERRAPLAFAAPAAQRSRGAVPSSGTPAGCRGTEENSRFLREDAGPGIPRDRGVDPLLVESVIDERRRRDAALEEWRRTQF